MAFEFKRIQFALYIAFATAVHKARGQSLQLWSLNLKTPFLIIRTALQCLQCGLVTRVREKLYPESECICACESPACLTIYILEEASKSYYRGRNGHVWVVVGLLVSIMPARKLIVEGDA
ncbi:hypothetical protein RF11_09705 [Thelohanellus kitauei]|uniref:Uncharacterized protein n=1 Tax=Thelohanellus kitauei TaxID=669202 RepID=A0A0C2N939_THEKT|nr:hypothetical protein RF11_09705 [Thelohanellus kitauei]